MRKLINKLKGAFPNVNDRLPENMSFSGPLMFIRSQAGIGFMDDVANRYPRFWKVWGWIGVGMFVALLFGMSYFIIESAVTMVQDPTMFSGSGLFEGSSQVPTASNLDDGTGGGLTNPKNYLVIPGVNEFLPLSVVFEIVVALGAAMVIHEFGHGVYCRVSDMEIKSTGLLTLGGIFPMGAFVEPDEDELDEGEPSELLPMFAAGVMNNLALTAVAFAVMAIIVSLFISPLAGAPVGAVLQGSPADHAGIEAGDRIIAVGGEPVEDTAELQSLIEAQSGETMELTVATREEQRVVTVEREVFLTEAPPTEANSDIYITDNVAMVNGEEVSSVSEFNALVDADSDGEVTITTENGATDTVKTEHVAVSHIGVQTYPSAMFLDFLTGSYDGSVVDNVVGVLSLPIGDAVGFAYNFGGFTPEVMNFYSSSIPFGFTIVNILFWTVWINFNLALFNTIPTYALDGGYVLRDLVRLSPIEGDAGAIAQKVVKTGMVACLLVMLFAPAVFQML